MKVLLDKNHRSRLINAGLIEVTTPSQATRGYSSYRDPETGSRYTFSPRGYAWRRTTAGTYQLNPRFYVPGNYHGNKAVKATVRTNDAGALLEMVLHGVENFRGA